MTVLVEDDRDGGCSWCRVATEEGKGDEKASVDYWTKGEELRKAKKWAEALVYFNRGVVANPQNASCWSSIAEVSLRQQYILGVEYSCGRMVCVRVLRVRSLTLLRL